MKKTGGNIFEEHVEKMVLAIVVVLCTWLLITHVLFSPNYIEYDGKKFVTSKIDDYILRETNALDDKLSGKPEAKEPYEPNVTDYTSLIASSMRDIDVSLYLPKPNHSMINLNDNRTYRIPYIGEVNNPSVEHIRAAAYVPLVEINQETLYELSVSEPNDIDLVTVESRFDVVGLYERFRESFAGLSLKEDWRDPCLAEPVFAAVQLERQEEFVDGSWSDWQVVPRSRVESRREMFEIIEEVEDLPTGGIKVRVLQFDEPSVRRELLQPESYQIASAAEQWFPPSLHKEYLGYKEDLRNKERSEALEAKRLEEERAKEAIRSKRKSRAERTKTKSSTSNIVGEGYYISESVSAKPEKKNSESTLAKRRERKMEKERELLARRKDILVTKSISDFEEGFEQISLCSEQDITQLSEGLLFWAHDDTVRPGKRYRYRIRLGVFNPIAGTDWFGEQDKQLKNKVVLWSEFSDVTESVEIPRKLYFFPRSAQESTDVVGIQIFKYVLGYWYSKSFNVRPGEVIGSVCELKKTEDEQALTIPDMIDYCTGAVLVDVASVNDWTGSKNMSERRYYDILYSFDGVQIEHFPISKNYWPEELKVEYSRIDKAVEEPKEPLREWGAKMITSPGSPRYKTSEPAGGATGGIEFFDESAAYER